MPGMGTVALRPAPFGIGGLFRLVEDFGADPTGVNDSTAAVTAAVAAAAVKGGTIIVAAGSYKFNAVLNNVTGVYFFAMGAVTVTSNSGTAHVFDFTGTTNQCGLIGGIWNLHGPATTGSCIHINQTFPALPITLENITCAGGVHGLFVDTNSGSVIVNNLLCNPSLGSAVLIAGAGTNNVWITKFQCTQGAAPTQSGYEVTGGIGHRLDMADIESCLHSILIDPATGVNVQDLRITNVTCATCSGTGVVLSGQGSPAGTITNTWLTNITSTGNNAGASGDGIDIFNGVSGLYIDNASCQSAANGDGLVINPSVVAGTNNIHIRGGTFSNNLGVSFGVGIVVAAAITGWSIEGATFGGNTNAGVLVPAVATDQYRILFNDTHAQSVLPISDSGTGTHKLVGPIGLAGYPTDGNL